MARPFAAIDSLFNSAFGRPDDAGRAPRTSQLASETPRER